MLFSHQYSRRFFWPRLSIMPRQDLIAVTLRGFSQFPPELRQLSVLSVRTRSLWVLVCSDPPVLKVLYNNYSPTPLWRLRMCFYQHDEVSNQVSVNKDTTNKRATVLNATGCQWMKYSGQASSSFSVAHVPMCVYRGAVCQPEHELDDCHNRQQPWYNIYIFI